MVARSSYSLKRVLVIIFFSAGVLILFNIEFGKYFYLGHLVGNKGFFFVKNFLKFIN